jgi:AbrB family looped-hinge helix DNA binding protein
MASAKLSTKGQIVIPKELRDARKWAAGMDIDCINTPEGILLKPKAPAKRYTLDDLYGIANYTGPPKTLADMERGIDEAMRERWERKKQ